MPRTILTDARVRALKPHKTVRDVRDARLRGFGVRVSSSGRRQFFIQCQHRGERIWKIVGETGTVSVGEARSLAAGMLAAIRRGEDAPRAPGETLFEAVAETVFRRYERVWKAGTLYVNRSYLRKQLLPHFAGRPIADIDRQEVRNWFARLHATPVAADRSMPILSVIMREAERLGMRPGRAPIPAGASGATAARVASGSSPTMKSAACPKGLPRMRPDGRGRWSFIRLLLLTGCRKGEILTLQWSDYRDGNLFLRDSKTGPRTVWLSEPARVVLDNLRRKGRWVFPALRGDRPCSANWVNNFWFRVRAEADLDDVRLHDLRHTVASLALRQGETVLVIGRLLGHRDPETTLKYIHLADTMVRDAAEAVGAALEG